ncbi:hypothetical protein [Kitasatospora indigofera]|uniref:hypothetical protein n=1 Tax=Kitasatospora indigofera TaxID=67307 RepID=UPI0033B24FB7
MPSPAPPPRRPAVPLSGPATSGLEEAEVALGLAPAKPDEIRSAPRIPMWPGVVVQLRAPLVMLLIAAVVPTPAIGDRRPPR